jgi:hypothetical protein
MAPKLSEDEIDDLLYAARTGDKDELTTLLSSLAEREKLSPAEIITSARDEGKSTCLHMATGNGHAGELFCLFHTPPHFINPDISINPLRQTHIQQTYPTITTFPPS